MKVELKKLKIFLKKLLIKNFDTWSANSIIEYLLWTEMSWINTQWLVKLTWDYSLLKVVSEWNIFIERETKLSQLINANKNPSLLVTQTATNNAIKKAKDSWFWIVWVRNIFTSNWDLSYYVNSIANNDLIWIVCCRCSADTCWLWSIEPVFWTNPIAFWFPTQQDPIVFDMATSAMTWYGLVLAKAQWKQIPENMAINSLWNRTQDPVEAMNGALLSFDRSYKWSWLAMMIEILAWPLVWWAWIDNKSFEEEWWTLIIAIDPELLVDTEVFKKNNSDLIEKVKNSKAYEWWIRIPWESSRAKYKEAKMTGYIEVDENVLREIWFVDN